jgi:hypothetical protein
MSDLILHWSSSQQMGNADRNARGHLVRCGETKTLCGCPTVRRTHISRRAEVRCWESMGDVLGEDFTLEDGMVSCRKCRKIATKETKNV